MFYADNKIKYQYGLLTQVGNAKPYVNDLTYVTDMQGIYRYIEEIEKRHNHYRQLFYIDNDFYENKYTIQCGGTYYKFLKRRVLEWSDVSIEDERPKYYDNVISMF